MEKKRRWVGVALTILLALCTGIVGSGVGYFFGSQHTSTAATNLVPRTATPTLTVTRTPTFKQTFSDAFTGGNIYGWLVGTPGTSNACWFASDGYHSAAETCF